MAALRTCDLPLSLLQLLAAGKKEAAFNTKTGEAPADYLPKLDDPNATAWSRFIALGLVLADMLQRSELK